MPNPYPVVNSLADLIWLLLPVVCTMAVLFLMVMILYWIFAIFWHWLKEE